LNFAIAKPFLSLPIYTKKFKITYFLLIFLIFSRVIFNLSFCNMLKIFLTLQLQASFIFLWHDELVFNL